MIKKDIEILIGEAIGAAQTQGLLPVVPIPEVTVEHPSQEEHGDYASNVALKMQRSAGLSPRAIAEAIVRALPQRDIFSAVTVAGPGFINFTLSDAWLARQVAVINAAGARWGDVQLGAGARVQVEFVSANPTGPMHIGHGRGAVLGDALAHVLAAAGYGVEREYYLNDAGAQMQAFYRTLYARYLQALGREAEVPPEGYHGQYMVDLAAAIAAEEGDRCASLPEEQAIEELGRIGLVRMVDQLRADLDLLGIQFDVWFSERSLFDTGLVPRVIDLLRQAGYITEREGATWFASTALGEDKDNVLIRSNGAPTYFASDVAYHYNKFVERQFDRVIDIWGADHQGHVPRMKAAVSAFGVDPARLTVLIAQIVTLKRGNEIVRMSKRTGDLVSLREVVEEVGADACRFFFLSRSADSQMDFDLELAKEQSNENPVYYVQYAHARIASILRYAEERGLDYADGDAALLTAEPELALIRRMLLLPEIVESAALSLEPHRLPHYAVELASVFHTFYKQCRVVSDDDLPLSKARLKLVLAAKTVLAKTLGLMGMTAPEQM